MHVPSTITMFPAIILAASLMPAAMATVDAMPRVDDRDDHPAVTVPATIDFGPHRTGSTVEGRVWLINRSDGPLQLMKVKGNCGCITIDDDDAVELAAHTARAVEFTYKAPEKDGVSKSKRLEFIFRDHASLSVRLDVAAKHDAEAEAPQPASPEDDDVIAVPGEVAFGEVEADSLVEGSAWLINAGDTPRRIESAKGDCGCIALEDFAAMTLRPFEARQVRFSVKTPKAHGKTKHTRITFQVADGEPLTLPIIMNTGVERVAKGDAAQK